MDDMRHPSIIHPRRIERSTPSSRVGIEQRGQQEAAFYGDGMCQCGHGRGMHDVFLGPCMTSGCGCKELRIVDEATKQ